MGKIIEAKVAFEGEGAIGVAREAVDAASEVPQEEEKFEGSKVLIAVPQKLDNGQVALVIVGQAKILGGVKLATDELKLGE